MWLWRVLCDVRRLLHNLRLGIEAWILATIA